MLKPNLRLAICQAQVDTNETQTARVSRAVQTLETLKEFEPHIVLFPETFPYIDEVSWENLNLDLWKEKSRDLNAVIIFGALVAGESYPENVAILVTPGGTVKKYVKQFRFVPGPYFTEEITLGKTSCLWSINAPSFGTLQVIPMICQDAWEAFSDVFLAAMKRVKDNNPVIVVILANAAVGYIDRWKELLSKKSQEHSVAIAYCNVGGRFTRGPITYGDGNSGIVIPHHGRLSPKSSWFGRSPQWRGMTIENWYLFNSTQTT